MKVFAFVVTVFLAGCTGPDIYGNNGRQVTQPGAASIVSMPRVTGNSRNGSVNGRASTTIGNRQTPARVRINTRMTDKGLDISPHLQSRWLNWSFR